MRDGRIDLVHPFFTALARSPVLTASQIELFSDFGPLVGHLWFAGSRHVLASHFSQNCSLRVGPVFLSAHNVLGKLPSLLTLMDWPAWKELADYFPFVVSKIFWVFLVAFYCLENLILEKQSFVPAPLGLGWAHLGVLPGLFQLYAYPICLLFSQLPSLINDIGLT